MPEFLFDFFRWTEPPLNLSSTSIKSIFYLIELAWKMVNVSNQQQQLQQPQIALIKSLTMTECVLIRKRETRMMHLIFDPVWDIDIEFSVDHHNLPLADDQTRIFHEIETMHPMFSTIINYYYYLIPIAMHQHSLTKHLQSI